MLDTIAVCLDAAGISGGGIDQLVVVGPSVSPSSETSFLGTGSPRPLSVSLAGIPATKLPLEVAHASLMRATVRGNSAGLLLAMDRATSGGAFVHIRDGTLTTFETIPWVDDLAWALERTADALGGHDHSPIAYLEAIATGDASAQSEGPVIFLLNQPFTIGCDRSALVGFIETVRAQAPGPLDGSSAHVGIQRARRRLAAGVLNSLADRFEEVGRRWCEHVGADSLLQAGNIFESSEFRARIARRPRSRRHSPVAPEQRIRSGCGASSVCIGRAPRLAGTGTIVRRTGGEDRARELPSRGRLRATLGSAPGARVGDLVVRGARRVVSGTRRLRASVARLTKHPRGSFGALRSREPQRVPARARRRSRLAADAAAVRLISASRVMSPLRILVPAPATDSQGSCRSNRPCREHEGDAVPSGRVSARVTARGASPAHRRPWVNQCLDVRFVRSPGLEPSRRGALGVRVCCGRAGNRTVPGEQGPLAAQGCAEAAHARRQHLR